VPVVASTTSTGERRKEKNELSFELTLFKKKNKSFTSGIPYQEERSSVSGIEIVLLPLI